VQSGAEALRAQRHRHFAAPSAHDVMPTLPPRLFSPVTFMRRCCFAGLLECCRRRSIRQRHGDIICSCRRAQPRQHDARARDCHDCSFLLRLYGAARKIYLPELSFSGTESSRIASAAAERSDATREYKATVFSQQPQPPPCAVLEHTEEQMLHQRAA